MISIQGDATDDSSVSSQSSPDDDYGKDEKTLSNVFENNTFLEHHLSCAETNAKGETSQLSLSLLDQSSRNSSLSGLQPEDVDDELDMTFRSRGCPLADLYPGMVNRVKQACSRQHTTEAAGLVLEKYRRWRQQPSRSRSNNSLSAPPRHFHHKQIGHGERLDRSLKICGIPQSPLKVATNQQAWSPLKVSQARVRRHSQPQPPLVMDFSSVSVTSYPKKVSLNDTFDVPELEPPSTLHISPSRPTGSRDLTLKSKRLSLAACSLQAVENYKYVAYDGASTSRSPVRSISSRNKVIFSRSPHTSLRSPGAHSMEGFSREPMRRRSMSESLTSSVHIPLKGFGHPEPHLSFASQPSPKRSASTLDPCRLRRHLSSDSFLPTGSSLWSREQLDDEFIKLYHWFVCQNKASSHQGPPCRFCARNGEVGNPISSSSTALDALALSPHRSLLRKRQLEMSRDSHPQSKRLREECYAPSPGSKRHVKETLRQRLSTLEPEQSRNRISFGSRNSNLLLRFNHQQHKR